MNRDAYREMALNEAEHWWFVGRRAVLQQIIERSLAPSKTSAAILEAGCGTGGNLATLAQYGSVDAFEYDDKARKLANARNIAAVTSGELPHRIEQQDEHYDLVGLLDVLEHIDDDIASLAALGHKLKPDGRMIITVPAMPWLWSAHDEHHHHKRRYTKSSLSKTISDAGLIVRDIGYFNALLFPLAVIARLKSRIMQSESGAHKMPPAMLNALLTQVFAQERHLVGRMPMPFGLSLYAVARRG